MCRILERFGKKNIKFPSIVHHKLDLLTLFDDEKSFCFVYEFDTLQLKKPVEALFFKYDPLFSELQIYFKKFNLS